MYRADTIVACATPAGRGGVSIVRCSGGQAQAIAEAVFRPRLAGPAEPWKMRLGTLLAADGCTAVDEAMAVYFPAGRSFTGEDTVEFHCHGSPVVVAQVLASAMAAGARPAERGEFTRRAVLNGRLDLLQAEAVADLVDARMVGGAAAAWQQLQGALSGRLGELRGRLVELLADVEADVDFTEDELPPVDPGARRLAIDEARRQVENLLGGFEAARRQREGCRVVLAGRPNAGKSSLLNRLVGSARMIVSEEPGTTRDVVEEEVDLGGLSFVMTDTAGIRDAAGPAESIAVERARTRADDADLLVLVVDASVQPTDEDPGFWASLAGSDTVVALNKTDLGAQVRGDHPALAGAGFVLDCSARTGEGCELLRAELVGRASALAAGDGAGISRVRHRAALERSLVPLGRAATLCAGDGPAELVAVEIREALAELAAVTDAVDNEEVLDRIFSEFCIGK